MSQALSASLEDYLEAIFNLSKANDEVHVKAIAEEVGVKMPSVTGALHKLNERKLVDYRPYETVQLTAEGHRIAEEVGRRHSVLTVFFSDVLGLAPAVAEENACRMEHAVDDEALERLTWYVEFTASCPLYSRHQRSDLGPDYEQDIAAIDWEKRLEEALRRIRSGEAPPARLPKSEARPHRS
jgi:DtxR family Mn-dependent transcriptional regulator